MTEHNTLPTEVSILGSGVAAFGDEFVGGLFGISKYDFGTGAGPVNACKLRFSDPQATSKDDWLPVGAEVICGGNRWKITYISDEQGDDAVVDLVYIAPVDSGTRSR